MTKCDFCNYSILKRGKLECDANCYIQKLNGCEDAIKKMEKCLTQHKDTTEEK